MPHTCGSSAKRGELKLLFEGKEAIYIEKGVARVRVFDLVVDTRGRRVGATVERILTKGMPVVTGFPPRWQIGAGDLSVFSRTYWAMGYGGWSLYFDPVVIAAVIHLVESFPNNMNEYEQYKRLLYLIQSEWPHYDELERIFPENSS